MHYGLIQVNLKELNKVNVREDNLREFDNLVKNDGCLFTLDVRPYYEMFLEFGVQFNGPLI